MPRPARPTNLSFFLRLARLSRFPFRFSELGNVGGRWVLAWKEAKRGQVYRVPAKPTNPLFAVSGEQPLSTGWWRDR